MPATNSELVTSYFVPDWLKTWRKSSRPSQNEVKKKLRAILDYL